MFNVKKEDIAPMGYVVTDESTWMKDVMDTLMNVAVATKQSVEILSECQEHLAAIRKATE